jgi:hypothetical protein
MKQVKSYIARTKKERIEVILNQGPSRTTQHCAIVLRDATSLFASLRVSAAAQDERTGGQIKGKSI